MSRTKDYAKTLPRRSSRKRASSRQPLGLWLFTIVICISFVGGLVYLSMQEKQKPKPQEVKASQAPKAKVQKEQALKQKPRFEFYNMLPEMSVADRIKKEAQIVKKQQTQPQYYAIQIAAVNHFEEADKLKAKLTLQGFDVKVNPIQSDKGRLYRVTIGPYPSAELANKDKLRLHHLRVDGFIIKV